MFYSIFLVLLGVYFGQEYNFPQVKTAFLAGVQYLNIRANEIQAELDEPEEVENTVRRVYNFVKNLFTVRH